jgi:hypothetical protein
MASNAAVDETMRPTKHRRRSMNDNFIPVVVLEQHATGARGDGDNLSD